MQYEFKEGAGKHRMQITRDGVKKTVLLKAGDVVELDDDQFAAVKDKFVEVGSRPAGKSSDELFAMAEAKKKEEQAAAAEAAAMAKAAALAKAKEAEEAALAAKAAGDKAAKTGAAGKG